MQSKKLTLLMFFAGIVLFCYFSYPHSYVYRYRLTLEINTPDGIKTGSSVIQVETALYPHWLQAISSGYTRFKGEAVFVDLDNKKNVIMLLENDRIIEHLVPQVILGKSYQQNKSDVDYAKQMINMLEASEEFEIPKDLLPTLITLKDINNPNSAVLLHTANQNIENNSSNDFAANNNIINRFDEVLGSGYSLKKAQLALTSEPITYNITNKIPGLIDKKLWDSHLPNYSLPIKTNTHTGVYSGELKVED